MTLEILGILAFLIGLIILLVMTMSGSFQAAGAKRAADSKLPARSTGAGLARAGGIILVLAGSLCLYDIYCVGFAGLIPAACAALGGMLWIVGKSLG